MAFSPYKFRPAASRDIRKLSGKFETMKQMKAEGKIRIAALENALSSEYLSLATVLKKCAKGRRCLNADYKQHPYSLTKANKRALN